MAHLARSLLTSLLFVGLPGCSAISDWVRETASSKAREVAEQAADAAFGQVEGVLVARIDESVRAEVDEAFADGAIEAGEVREIALKVADERGAEIVAQIMGRVQSGEAKEIPRDLLSELGPVAGLVLAYMLKQWAQGRGVKIGQAQAKGAP